MVRHDKRRARFGHSYRPRRRYHPGGYIHSDWCVDVMPMWPGEVYLAADYLVDPTRYGDMLRATLRDIRRSSPLRHPTPESETR